VHEAVKIFVTGGVEMVGKYAIEIFYKFPGHLPKSGVMGQELDSRQSIVKDADREV